MAIAILPVFPVEMKALSDTISVACKDERVSYFYGLLPIYTHHANDSKTFYWVASQLYDAGHCSQSRLVEFFQVTPQSIKRAYKKFRQSGPGAFFEDRKSGKRRPSVLTDAIIKLAQEQLDKGLPKKEVALNLKVKPDTFSKAIKAGRLFEKKK